MSADGAGSETGPGSGAGDRGPPPPPDWSAADAALARARERSAKRAEKRAGGEKARSEERHFRAWSVGWDIATTFLGGLILGFLLDLVFGTRPWIMVVLGVIGLAGGFARFLRGAMAMNREMAEEAARERAARAARVDPGARVRGEEASEGGGGSGDGAGERSPGR